MVQKKKKKKFQPGAWMFVCYDCYVLSGRGLYDELIIRPEESYRLWRVVVCDQETSWTRRHSPRWAAEPEKINNKLLKDHVLFSAIAYSHLLRSF
jgi:hypothetical protein